MSHVVQFHDLVGLINSKCAEITARGTLSSQETDVINYLRGVNEQLLAYCEETPECPFYVVCPEQPGASK